MIFEIDQLKITIRIKLRKLLSHYQKYHEKFDPGNFIT